ncbi:hypothetical protein M3M50_16055 [Pseudomonas bijieensis]|uniref:hypothetical protein n=1 Tax=Pseudomonas bijieensis TaxID=2681983 RepID=UPI00200D371B|nr:hypothetical protein [Pseudomonas bijieensis]UQI28491.1 hypothetical protein M3M50_16055 [Pseudomonas bijieensis]
MNTSKIFRAIFSLLLCLALTDNVNALGAKDSSNSNDDTYRLLDTVNDISEGEYIDKVDTVNGNLLVMQKDFFIPGQGGLDITVWRRYDMLRQSAGLGATLNSSYRWAELGPGWSLEVAPRISEMNTYFTAISGREASVAYLNDMLVELCTSNNTHEQNTHSWTKNSKHTQFPVLEIPGGGRETIYSVGGHIGKTKSNWRVMCLNNNITVTSPQGTTYDYGSISERRIGIAHMNDSYFNEATEESDPPRTETYMVPKSARDPNGNTLTFTYKTVGKAIQPWVMPSYNPPNLWEWISDDPTSYEKPAVQLATISASDGRSISFEHDPVTGRIITATSNSGKKISYQYQLPDALNSRSLSRVTYSTGETWQYKYAPGTYLDGYNTRTIPLNTANITARKLTSIIYPTGGTVNYTYTYSNYDARASLSHLSWYVHDTAEKISSRILSTGEKWSYSYTKGRNGTYDITTVTGPEGVSTYKYIGPSYKNTTALPGVPEETLWMIGSLVEKVDPLGNTEKYKWQSRVITGGKEIIVDLGYGMDTQIRAADLAEKSIVLDGLTYKTTYSDYDSFGNVGTVTEIGPTGNIRITKNIYANDTSKWIIGLHKSESSPAGDMSQTFDVNGRVLSVTKNGVTTGFTYDSNGNAASKTMPGGGVYKYSNYKLGTPQTELSPQNITISRTVDNAGNVTAETNGEGATTKFTYDTLNRVTSIVPALGNAKTITFTPNSRVATRGALVETTLYDAFARVASVTLGGITTRYQYDGLGRRTFVSDPSVTTGTRYQYDALGRATRITNADNSFQSIIYKNGSRSVTDERGKTTTYNYRAYGDPTKRQLMSIDAPESSANIAFTRNTRDQIATISQGGFIRNYTYNSNGYLTSVSNPETGITTYGRDIAGNMTSKKTGASGVTNYTYDNLNRLIKTTYPGSTPAITNTYNKDSKLLTSNASGGNRSFAYDAAGNLIQESLALDGKVFTAKYAYNGNDQLSSITYPQSGRVVSYTPDALGRPTTVSGYVTNVKYWPSGLIQSITYSNGTVSTYGQNARLWPSSFVTQKTTPAGVYLNSSYTYDGVGNLATVRDTADSNFNRTLGYDNINRLTSAVGFWGQGSITYDGGGNLTKQTLGQSSLAYTYDTSNRLSSVSGLRASTFGYDAYGNVSSSLGNTYTYNDVPNLTCINCAVPAKKVEYSYDGLNHRSAVTKASGKVYEMHDSNGKPLIELDAGVLTEYLYLGDKRIAQRVSP